MVVASLQNKARAKLGDGVWWCTERSLSQATPYQVAELKSRWLVGQTCYDLCSGIGGDSIALAKTIRDQNTVIIAVDRDPTIVAMARDNIRLNTPNSHPSVTVACDDVAEIEIPQGSSVHIDPDRRDGVGRKVRPEDYSPDWGTVERILNRCDGGIVKLAPAAEMADHCERHRLWISLSGSVREQTLLTGHCVDAAGMDLGAALPLGERSAIIVNRQTTVAKFSAAVDCESVARADGPEEFIVDPDAAIRAAGLTESFAISSGLKLIGGPAGFLTGDIAVDSDLAICERVIWSGSCDDRKLRKTLRTMNCFPSRIKTRGVSQDPNALERRYRECGEQPVTLWIGKGNRRQYAVLSQEIR